MSQAPQDENEKKYMLKLLLLGDLAVGKTSLINRYIQGKFSEDYQPTLGVNIVRKDIRFVKINALVRLIIWDIAGQQKYSISREAYFQGALGALFVYDISRDSTFKNIKTKWHQDFKNYAKKDGINVLIGNKSDLTNERMVTEEEGRELATDLKAIKFIETSAKYGVNVEDAFRAIVLQALENMGVKL